MPAWDAVILDRGGARLGAMYSVVEIVRFDDEVSIPVAEFGPVQQGTIDR